MERTLAIIKPDAVERGLTGRILARIEEKGFKIVGMKKIHLSLAQAEGFYYVHKERPFFKDLCSFMSRSPVVVLCLEKENAIADWRTLMGQPTRPTPNLAPSARILPGTSKRTLPTAPMHRKPLPSRSTISSTA